MYKRVFQIMVLEVKTMLLVKLSSVALSDNESRSSAEG